VVAWCRTNQEQGVLSPSLVNSGQVFFGEDFSRNRELILVHGEIIEA
jgi:hypothetical protein